MAADFWQQAQLEEQEQHELQEAIDWWMARRDQFNESNEESENEDSPEIRDQSVLGMGEHEIQMFQPQ